MKKILLIEDDVEIRNLLKSRLLPDNITIFEFIPQSHGQTEAIEELEKLLTEETFNLAILDHDLWGQLKGPCFVPILDKNKTAFIAISKDFGHFKNFTSSQNIGSVLKDYGSRGLKAEEFLNNLETIIQK